MKNLFVILLAATATILQGCDKKNSSAGNTPDANFSVSGYETAAPCPVTFINTSTNATSYLWNFGDGNTSTSSNPVHTYASNGTYLLKLRVTGADGADSVCKLLSIATAPPSNKSEFSYFFDKCTGYPVGASFKTVNPASTNTVWDFGNGVINVNRDPIVQFLLPGDYTITYSSQLGAIRDTVVRIIRIQ